MCGTSVRFIARDFAFVIGMKFSGNIANYDANIWKVALNHIHITYLKGKDKDAMSKEELEVCFDNLNFKAKHDVVKAALVYLLNLGPLRLPYKTH